MAAAVTLLVGTSLGFLYKLPVSTELDLEPSLHFTDPIVVTDPHLKDGPVLITVDYTIAQDDVPEFAKVMRSVKRIRRRDGAVRWRLFQDTADPKHYVETFLVESWGEHMRQHARLTNEDRTILDVANSFHREETQPRVTHLIAEDV
jgi:quinol monooxygenase YgiN